MKIEKFVNKIVQGHTIEVLKEMPENSVDMVITSPPYFCYDENTDILTGNGFKNISEIKIKDIVLTVNPENLQLEWIKVKSVNKWKYEGEMIHFLNAHIDLLVTPNHRMLVFNDKYQFIKSKIKNANNQKYITNKNVNGMCFIEAQNIKYGYITPKTGFKWRGKKLKYFILPELKVIYNKQEREYSSKKIKIEDWLAFFGLFIAEGSVRGSRGGKKNRYEISIKQKIPNDQQVRDILNKIPFKYREYRYENDIICFSITDRQLWEYLKQFGNSHEKFVPKEIKELSPRLLKIFLDWYLFGDGNVNRKNTTHEVISCYSVSEKLKENLIEISLKIGSNVSIHDKNFLTFLRRKSVKLKQTMKKVKYNGFVFGVEVEKNYTLCVKRGNKVIFSGNSLRNYGTEYQIWGGDSNCQHEWDDVTSKVASGMIGMNERIQKEKSNKDSKFVSNEFDRPKESKSSVCKRCGCWKGELGQEPTLESFVEHLVMVFDEVKRVLKDTGSIYVNLGDTYGGNASVSSQGGRAGFGTEREEVVYRGYDKCLLMIPERFAISMIQHGWILRNKIIWHKPNSMPTSVDDRLKNTYEFVYHFVKKKKYYYDLNAIREEHKTQENRPWGIDRVKNYGYDTKYNQTDLVQYKNKPQNDDIIKLSPKYERESGHSNRQGLNRKLDTITIKAYKQYQEPIAKFLKKHITKEHKPILDETFGEYKWGHFIRTDLSGAALPGVEDWFKLKEILGFDDTFDNMIYEVQKLNIPIFSSGKNPGDMWNINTQPFPESHFAVFPEDLVLKPILASCPEFVCKKCGQPRVKIYEKGQPIDEWKKDCGADSQGEYKGQGQKEYEENNVQNPSDVKRRILDGMCEKVLTGYVQCECNADFEPGIVMDIFSGAGTTCLVSSKLNRRFIGIELSEKFCKMSLKRIDKEGSTLFIGPNQPEILYLKNGKLENGKE